MLSAPQDVLQRLEREASEEKIAELLGAQIDKMRKGCDTGR